MALVGILSATDALKQSLESNFTSLGANTLTIRNSQGGFFVGNADYRQNPKISFREALGFKERMDYPGSKTSLTYRASGIAKLSYNNISTNPNTSITATDENYMYTGGFELAEGRNFTVDDVYSGRNYTILGSETKTDLFGDAPASGQTIRIQGKPYLVIGVLQ
jgi:putative ABC transport system permease protein